MHTHTYTCTYCIYTYTFINIHTYTFFFCFILICFSFLILFSHRMSLVGIKRQLRYFGMTCGGLMGMYELCQDTAQREILFFLSLSLPTSSSSCLTLVFYMSFIVVYFPFHLCCSLSFHSLVFVIHIPSFHLICTSYNFCFPICSFPIFLYAIY